MTHERSETVQDLDGTWINVYGKGTPQAGQQLPDTTWFSSAEEASAAAQARSDAYGRNALRKFKARPRGAMK